MKKLLIIPFILLACSDDPYEVNVAYNQAFIKAFVGNGDNPPIIEVIDIYGTILQEDIIKEDTVFFLYDTDSSFETGDFYDLLIRYDNPDWFLVEVIEQLYD